MIDGNELLEKTGAGSLTLTGANTYSGGTDLLAGALAVGNSNALSTGDVAVTGGILMTSGGPMTINVGGNYSQGISGALQLGLAGTTAGQWDVLNVAGTSSLGGTLKLVSDGGFLPSAGTFVVVASGGALSGTFGTLSDSFFKPVSVAYTANQAQVDILSFAQLGTTSNQVSIGTALDSLGGSGNPVLSNYLTSVPLSELPKVYDEISPANLTPMYQIGFSNSEAQAQLVGQRLEALFGGSGFGWAGSALRYNSETPLFASTLSMADEMLIAKRSSNKKTNPTGEPAPDTSNAGDSSTPAAKPATDDWDVFVSGAGNFGSLTGTPNAQGYNFSTGGLTACMDHRLGQDLVGGLLLGFTQSGTTQPDGTTVSVTGGQLGLYGGMQRGQVHAEALISGGLNSYTTKRTTVGGIATASPQGTQFSGQLGAGYDWTLDKVKVGPFVSGQYTYVQVNNFTETGSWVPATVPSQGEGSFLTDLGAKASRNFDLGGDFILSPNVSVAWEHVYQGNLDSLSANLGTSGSSFTVDGPLTGTDGVAVGAGVNAHISQGLNAYVQYQGKLGITNYDSQDVAGGVNFGF